VIRPVDVGGNAAHVAAVLRRDVVLQERAVMKELVGEQDLTLLNKEKDDLTTRKARLGELFHITEEMRLLGERKELLEGRSVS